MTYRYREIRFSFQTDKTVCAVLIEDDLHSEWRAKSFHATISAVDIMQALTTVDSPINWQPPQTME